MKSIIYGVGLLHYSKKTKSWDVVLMQIFSKLENAKAYIHDNDPVHLFECFYSHAVIEEIKICDMKNNKFDPLNHKFWWYENKYKSGKCKVVECQPIEDLVGKGVIPNIFCKYF